MSARLAWLVERDTDGVFRGSTRWPVAVLVAALAASIGAALWVHLAGNVGLYGDEPSHLLHGRRVFDSATPGFGQLGNYWPPLQHMLELPFVWIDALYQSGWAGAIPAMLFYVLGVVGAYRVGLELTLDRSIGALAAFAFGANPNLLLLQSAAMLESGIAMGLVWVVASLMRFVRTGRFRDVVAAGLWTSVAGWATWGALMGPVYGALVVAVAARRRHRFEWKKVETFVIAYVLAGGYTLLLWTGWNFYIQGGDALYILNYEQPVGQLLSNPDFSGEQGNPLFAVGNYGAAVWDLIGPAMTVLMAVVAVAAIVRRQLIHPAGMAVLAGCVVVGYMTLHGTAIGSPTFAEFAGLDSHESRSTNNRYALWIMPFVPVAVGLLAQGARPRRVAAAAVTVAGMVWFLPFAGGVATLDPKPKSDRAYRVEIGIGDALRRLAAKHEHVLMSSINAGDRFIWRSELDASRFITETNGELFESALERPASHATAVFVAHGATVSKRLRPGELRAHGFHRVWVARHIGGGVAFSFWQRGKAPTEEVALR
jgi:hypothetical protein